MRFVPGSAEAADESAAVERTLRDGFAATVEARRQNRQGKATADQA